MFKSNPHTPLLKRWFVFNIVGLLGIFVQFSTLAMLVSIFRLHYLAATFLAVEVTILHNFHWHERWTWADRRRKAQDTVFARMVRFHLTNGIISIIGNMVLMTLFVENFSIGYLPANGLSIAICSIFNFFAGDRIVYCSNRVQTKTGELHMCMKHGRKSSQALFLVAVFFFCHPQSMKSAELKPVTVKAWNAYVEETEQRIEREIKSNNRFLIADFQHEDKVIHEHKRLLSGEIVVKRMHSDNENLSVNLPGGKIHHWRGSIFIPGVDLDFVMSRVENPESEDMAQEDVLESRVMEYSPQGLKLFLKLQRSKIITVVYNTEHNILFGRHSEMKASSSSVATKIAEVEQTKGKVEREKPEGKDHGFLWRMNSYWRYKQLDGGVIVECESLTLSRKIPKLLDYMIRPIIKRIALESMERTLLSMRSRMEQDSDKTAFLKTTRNPVTGQN